MLLLSFLMSVCFAGLKNQLPFLDGTIIDYELEGPWITVEDFTPSTSM